MGYCKQLDELFEVNSDHTAAAAAAAAAAGRYTFICRQDDNAFIPSVPEWFDHFHLNVLVYYKKLENGVLVLRSDKSFFMWRKYFLERSKLLEIAFGATLYRVDIPQGVEESIFDEVIRLARSMVIDDSNNIVVHRQVLPMTVEVVICENEEEMSARTFRDSRVDEAFPARPKNYNKAVHECRAISEVVGGLEKVATESCSVKPRCAICLDAILVGSRMPCSHIYHANCIYRWLSWRLLKEASKGATIATIATNPGRN